MRSPQAAADAWVSGMQASQQKVTDGINSVTESPTAAAARNLDKYVQNTAAAVNSGKMASKLNAVTLQDWKNAAIAKVGRIGSGATAAKPKMMKHLQQWLPFVANVRAQVKQMPSTTPQDRIQRMVFNATQLATFKPQ